MHTISKVISNRNDQKIEKSKILKNSWIESNELIDLQMNVYTSKKSIMRNDHFNLLKSIFRQKNVSIFYTDEAQNKSKIISATVVLYQNSNTFYKCWNLEIEMSIEKSELYAIDKAIEWALDLREKSTDIWIFIDSQKSIDLIEKSRHFLIKNIH